jgi:hypothetical protein
MSTKLIFGSVIAAVLLGLYVYLSWSAIALVDCTPQPGCLEGFTDQMASALSLIGGLVSALVIAELAVTQPGEVPVARALGESPGNVRTNFIKTLTVIYIGVWIFIGVWALVTGWRYPDRIETLTDLGQSWFGLAIAAGYAYFGISQS